MKDNITIISYPKSGRTWLRALLGKYLVSKYNLPEKNILETHLLTKDAKLPIVGFTHDGSEWTSGDPPKLLNNIEYYNLPKDKKKYKNRRVVLLSRELKDTIVSAFFQANKREHVFHGSISDFIRDDRFGVKRIITFYNNWWKSKDTPQDFLHITYEDMHREPKTVLIRVLNFIGEKEIDTTDVDISIDFCSFEKLKEAEKENKFNSFRLRTATNQDPESFKVRRGKIGGYTEYLSVEDIEYINQIEREYKRKP